MTRNFSPESQKWLHDYHGSIDSTALLLAFEAGAATRSAQLQAGGEQLEAVRETNRMLSRQLQEAQAKLTAIHQLYNARCAATIDQITDAEELFLADISEALETTTDREPEPGDGPDYHSEHSYWLGRQP